MALVAKYELPGGFAALWHITERAEDLMSHIRLSNEEQQFYDTVKHEGRKAEWLAWHIMVRELIGEDAYTDYDVPGQPLLVSHRGRISVSHAGDYVVLYYRSEQCGVDIENLGRDFSRIASRVISQEESVYKDGLGENFFHALMWCAKEAVFKFAGKEGVDFKNDIRIISLDSRLQELTAYMREAGKVRLKYIVYDNHIIVYTV